MSNIKVYRYGLLPPIQRADEVREQMLLAHRYRNTLVEIERARRDALRALAASHGDIAALEAAAANASSALSAAVRAAGAAKSLTRTKTAPEPLRDAVTSARAARRIALLAWGRARAALRTDPHVQSETARIAACAGALRRGARALSGLMHGTYSLVEDAAQKSHSALPLYDGAGPNNPRFVRWSCEGRIGVQLAQASARPARDGRAARKARPALDVPTLMAASDTRVRIEAAAPSQHADPKSKRSAKYNRCVLVLRVGSNEDRTARFARFPMLMHRPLPEGARIKYVVVQLRLIGPREEWSVLFTLDCSAVAPRQSTGVGRVSLDIGWRVIDDGVRVATWRGDDGATGYLVLDGHVLGGSRKADELQSGRKRDFNKARRALLIHGLQDIGATMPGWLRDATKHLALWKSAGRLAALCRRWRNARFDGDAAAYDALEAWRYHDHHLWAWECSQRTKYLRHRRELYRLFAAGLATRYAAVVFEAFDLRDVAVLPPVEAIGQFGGEEEARANRVRAATSELRDVVRNAFRGRGGTDTKVDAALTTRTCAACGSIELWDQAAEVRHACSSCGADWDQDDNAATNLLAWCERSGGAETTGAARKRRKLTDPAHEGESRWARAKRMGAEKRAKPGGARSASSEPAE